MSLAGLDSWKSSGCEYPGDDAPPDDERDDDMGDEKIERIDEWIAGASVLELKRAYFGIEREVARRKAELANEAKELEQFEKPQRATRSDKGSKRPKIEIVVPAGQTLKDVLEPIEVRS